MADSAPLLDRIQAVLRESGRPMRAIDIARKLCGADGADESEMKKRVNKVLYAQQSSGEVVMVSKSPPKWQLGPSKAGQTSSPATVGKTPPTGVPVSSDAAAIESDTAKMALASPTSPHDHRGPGTPPTQTRDASVPPSTSHSSTAVAISQPPPVDTTVVADTPSRGETPSTSSGSETELEASIRRVLNEAGAGMTALSIAKAVGRRKASDVNPVLYSLQERGAVRKVKEAGSPRPIWLLPTHGSSSPSPVTHHPTDGSPGTRPRQNGEQKVRVPDAVTTASKEVAKCSRRLYTREDSSGGEITFRPVATSSGENVLPQIKAEIEQEDETGSIELPSVDDKRSDPGSESQVSTELEAVILRLLGCRTTMKSSDISDELNLDTRAPILKALMKLKDDGKVNEHPNAEPDISSWSLITSG